MESLQAFIFRLDHRLSEAMKHNIIGLGWSLAPHAGDHKDWILLKNELRKSYPDLYKEKERALGNAAGSFWRFLFEMKQNDLLVLPVTGGFHLAVVTGDPIFDDSKASLDSDFAWRRAVKWITPVPILRNHACNELQKRMKARNTCVNATDLIQDIRDAQVRKKPLTFTDAVLSGAYISVANALQSAVTDLGLEYVVAKLASASGAVSIVLPKNSRISGDADVMATYDLKIGSQEASIKVAYQVKQHQGKTPEYGVRQLIERMEVSGDIDRGCLVTTAKSLNHEALELAVSNNIIVMTEKELVEWVLMVGLAALAE